MTNYLKNLCVYCEKPVSLGAERCPECNSSTFVVSARFRPPKKGSKDWKKLKEALINWYRINVNELPPTNYLVRLMYPNLAPHKRKRGWRGV